jgi:RNA polymerase sigma-70 factor (ECF subfamily)
MTDRAFEELVAPHRAEIRLHCYRMLGSSHDGDDMVQETLVRAWRARESQEDPHAARAWLYRIATNVCLDELARRPKRGIPSGVGAPLDPGKDPAAPGEEQWVEPCPDAWLEGAPRDPAAGVELKESIALAFVVALQVLTPPQRAVLLLRDVVGLSADEAAEALDMSVSAANSALHRARTAVSDAPAPKPDVDEELLARYVRAWEAADVDAILALLHEEVTAAMPPSPSWVSGRAAFEVFMRRRIMPRVVASGGGRFVRCDANGQPAFGFYRGGEAEAVHIPTVRGGKVVAIDHFMMPSLFPIFGLPLTNTASAR